MPLSVATLVERPEIQALAMDEIDRRTGDLSNFEKIKKIAFLENQLTIVAEELTPTLKVRRSTIEKKYQAAIDQLYAA